MYKLFRQNNGQVEQVPVNQPVEDTTPPSVEEAFPNPLEAKGEPNGVAPFVLQEQRQFELIKQNENQQAKFQTAKLQNNNYQIINFRISPTDSVDVRNNYINDYNEATAVGTAMDAGIMFGTNTADVTKAKYYNIVYANCRLSTSAASAQPLDNPCYVEFYLGQKLPTGDFVGKIPTQIETSGNTTGITSLSYTGADFGVQNFGIDVFNENAYYTQSPDLKGMRAAGIALKRINLSFAAAMTVSNIRLDFEIAIDLRTEGNNY